MKVYSISANCVNGGYTDSVTIFDARETKNSLIWPGRRLDKSQLDVYRTNEDQTLIKVITADEDKVEDHIKEVRRRMQERLEELRLQAYRSVNAMWEHRAKNDEKTWRERARIHEEV